LRAVTPAAEASALSDATAACAARKGGGVAAPANPAAPSANTAKAAATASGHAGPRPGGRRTRRAGWREANGDERVISDEYQG